MEGFGRYNDELTRKQLAGMAKTDDSPTEEAGVLGVEGVGAGKSEDIEAVEKGRTYVKMTDVATQDTINILQGKPKEVSDIYNESDKDDQAKPGTSIEMFHKHPGEDLRASGIDGDLGAWRHQYETFGTEYQWIIGFDEDGCMYKVKYRRDGQIVTHMAGGEQVTVSKTKEGEYMTGVKEATYDQLGNVKDLCDTQDEIENLKESLFSGRFEYPGGQSMTGNRSITQAA